MTGYLWKECEINIFYIDECPREAARSLVDRHVVKMILESAQLLSTAHRVLDGTKNVLFDSREFHLYKATHINHPSCKWVRASTLHYEWLFHHFQEMCDEYTFRYDKIHKTSRLVTWLKEPPNNMPNIEFVQPPCAMPERYMVENNSLESYRMYYVDAKAHLHSWRRRVMPPWIEIVHQRYKSS